MMNDNRGIGNRILNLGILKIIERNIKNIFRILQKRLKGNPYRGILHTTFDILYILI